MEKKSIKFVNKLINKYDKSFKYSRDELVDCYAYDSKSKRYITCCNSSGDCFVEEFRKKSSVEDYFNNPSKSVSEIYRDDRRRKVSKDFSGVCELKELPKGTFFRTLKGKETYRKGFYDRSSKTYSCSKGSDVWGSERFIKGTTKVRTDFEY